MSKTANPTSLKLEIGICDKKLYFLILSLYEKKKMFFFFYTIFSCLLHYIFPKYQHWKIIVSPEQL